MNKTISVNIGGLPYIVDEDAYNMLSSYFAQIERRMSPAERVEIMEDVESRIADIFAEQLGARVQVINVRMVSHAISMIGNADEFGDAPTYQTPPSPQSEAPKQETFSNRFKFQRSRTDKVLGGICGGLAPELGVDVTLVRIVMILVSFLTFSVTMWVYIILWIIVPEAPITTNSENNERR